MTLVAAMINVAITGLYADTLRDGLRVHTWQEPQLVELEKQLGEINLPSLLAESLREERAGVCRVLETVPLTKLDELRSGKTTTSFWQKIGDPKFWLLSHVPKGWVYRNMRTAASLEQSFLEGVDATNGVVRPEVAQQAMRGTEKAFTRFSPGTCLAAWMVPNYDRAARTTAYNQTLVNQALIACALGRYRLAKGAYPQNLDPLRPEFLKVLPNDPINGGPLHYSLLSNGLYSLYSVGWNASDDHGTVATGKEGRMYPTETGDWVWQTQPGI